MNYKHLTLEERYHIQAYKKAGYKQKEIANEIGVNPSTICRELKRNSSTQIKNYSAKPANRASCDRRMYASKKSNMKIAAILSEINTNFKNSKKHGIKIAIFVKNQK